METTPQERLRQELAAIKAEVEQAERRLEESKEEAKRFLLEKNIKRELERTANKSELESTRRQLSIAMGCNIRQSQVIARYRDFLLQVIPAAFETVPAVSSVEVHKILKEAVRIIEEQDVLPDDMLEFCENLVAVRDPL